MLQWLPILTHFIGARDDIDLRGIYIPVAANLVLATIITVIFFVLRRRYRLAAFIGLLLSSLMLGYGYDGRLSAIYPTFQALLPWTDFGSLQGEAFSLIFIVLLLVGSYWSGRLAEHWLARRPKLSADIVPALFIAVAVTFLLQFVPFVSTVTKEWPQFNYRPAALNWNAKVQNGKRPDIYYIVLDDETGPQALQTQVGYDESDFLQSLRGLGYYVPNTSYASYPATTESISATMSANYNRDIITKFSHAALQIIIPFHLTIQYSPVAQQLKAIGYRYIELGNWYETSTRAPLADEFFEQFSQLTLFGRTTILENWALGQINQSPFWRFFQSGIHFGHFAVAQYSNADGPQLPLDQLQKLSEEASTNQGSRFIFAHILLPHNPYYFNADGSQNPYPYADNTGELLQTKYLNQLKFVNSQLLSILQQIDRTSHGQAVVVLQSDEGPELAFFRTTDAQLDTMPAWNTSDLQLKYNITAAYHIPNSQPADLAQGADTINVFRLIFNTDFQTKLPYLPRCYYGYSGSEGKPMMLANINQQLTGQANPACAPDGSGPR